MKPKILIVDDDADLVELLQVWFEGNGIDVTVCTDPLNAVNEATASEPDMIIIDVYMAGLSGFDVARLLKKEHETADIPILFISARMDMETASNAFMVGAMDVLKKPIDLHSLLQKAKPLLDFSKVHKLIKEILH